MAALFLDHAAASCGWTSGQRGLAHDKQCNFRRGRLLGISCNGMQPGGQMMSLRSEWLGEGSLANGMSMQKKGRNGSRMKVRAGLEELAHNQVLVSAATACTLGQLAKPFAAALAGKGFNWKLMIKSGGMPSSHSAAVTATATALAFERGLSDGVFGLSVILAGIVMYDAQGVRNAVGKQAKVINTMVVSYVPLPQSEPATTLPVATPSPAAIGSELARSPVQAELDFLENAKTSPSTARPPPIIATLEDTAPGTSKSQSLTNGAATETANRSYERSSKFFEMAEQLPTMKVGEVDIQELGNQDGWRLLPLKESIGHTKVEVLAGAVWGVLITNIFHGIYNP